MNFGVIVKEEKQGHTFVQTFSLAKSLKKFREKGKEVVMAEMKQIHDQIVFKPIKVEDLETIKRKQAMETSLVSS